MKACRSNLTAATRRAVGALFVAACLGAPSSMATPLPNPPFQGGFVPPDAATAAVEEQVATFFTKTDVRALAGCTLGLMKGLFVANQRGDASAAALADATYRACRFKEGQTWVRYRDTLLSAGGLPACLGTAGELDVMHGTLTSDFGITMTNLFCDGALTSYGPHVPPDAATYSHTTKVAQILFRFADRTARCKIKYADRVAAAGGDPVKLTTAARAYLYCYLRTGNAAYDAIPRLYALSSGPPCLPESSALALLQETLASWDLVDAVYCAP